MPLLKTIKNAFGEFPNCYYRIGEISYNSTDIGLKITLHGFVSETDFETFRTALESVQEKLADHTAKAATLSALIPPDGATADETRKLEDQSIVPRALLKQAEIAFNAAQAAMTAPNAKRLENIEIAVPVADIADLLTDGTPDIAKIEAWVEAQSEWRQ